MYHRRDLGRIGWQRGSLYGNGGANDYQSPQATYSFIDGLGKRDINHHFVSVTLDLEEPLVCFVSQLLRPKLVNDDALRAPHTSITSRIFNYRW